MLAQLTAEAATTFIERLPEILKAAATNPLALVALVVLVLAVFSYFFFKDSREKNKLTVFRIVVGSILVLALVVIYQWHKSAPADKPLTGGSLSNTPADPANHLALRDCKVSGFVYNEDLQPARGIQNVKLAYRASSPTNLAPVPVATTGPNGHFSFNCSQIDPNAFPIFLSASFAKQVIESDDTLLFGDNTEVNLYISPHAVSNHYRLNKEPLRVSSAQLFRTNYAFVRTPATITRLPANGVVSLPKTNRISREAIERLRRIQ